MPVAKLTFLDSFTRVSFVVDPAESERRTRLPSACEGDQDFLISVRDGSEVFRSAAQVGMRLLRAGPS
jgi:hypothetical protein